MLTSLRLLNNNRQTLLAALGLQVLYTHTQLYTFPLQTFSPHSGAAPQHPSSSAHSKRDHHGQSSQLVELCKRFELSNDDINKEVSDDHILEIYPQLENWRLVAVHLGLTQADVQAIVSQATLGGETLMRVYMLQEWKKKKRLDGTATYQVLLKALIKCNCSESALQVCKLLT